MVSHAQQFKSNHITNSHEFTNKSFHAKTTLEPKAKLKVPTLNHDTFSATVFVLSRWSVLTISTKPKLVKINN